MADIRTLFALIPPSQIDDAWVGIVIPHELTHLVFDTASKNPYHFPPRWLNEGLAVYVSQGYDASDRAHRRGARPGRHLIPLDGLIGQFPTTADRFFLAYAESVSAVDYMVRTYGKDALVALIRSYADGRTDDEAFKAALGVDITAFGDAWLADVGASSRPHTARSRRRPDPSRRHGPGGRRRSPAVTRAVPPGARAERPAGGRARRRHGRVGRHAGLDGAAGGGHRGHRGRPRSSGGAAGPGAAGQRP